ncbi:CDP-alcohol phosphatidyltransferase family protein [Alphaproteobacteria bacterium]|nr:CDP-alcohol phosphatidyltransferase family protein [Alphaproteobacteria bacterium]
MFDRQIQNFTQKPLKYIAKLFLKFISPNQMTSIGFVFGILMCISIAIDQYLIGIVFLFLNRLSDGLDGVMARLTAPTPLGGYLDIVLDFLVYGGFVLSFGITDQDNTFLSMILLFCYIGTGTTFLAKAAILPSLTHQNNDIPKSFHYAVGLVEGSETIVFMFLCLLFPNLFVYLSSIFIALCLITIVFRIIVCYKEINY